MGTLFHIERVDRIDLRSARLQFEEDRGRQKSAPPRNFECRVVVVRSAHCRANTQEETKLDGKSGKPVAS